MVIRQQLQRQIHQHKEESLSAVCPLNTDGGKENGY